MEDTIDIAAQFNKIREFIPDSATHVVMTIPSRHNAGMWRLEDGMFIAEAADKMVVYGENPNKRESRLFITHLHAKDYLTTVADDDTDDEVLAVLFEHDMEASNLIVIPGGNASLLVNGNVPKVRKFN